MLTALKLGHWNKSWRYQGLMIGSTDTAPLLVVCSCRWVGFDIPATLYMKTQGAASLGLGGVMMWEATLDGVDQPLLKVRDGEVGNGQR
jgi:hypothetical protein